MKRKVDNQQMNMIRISIFLLLITGSFSGMLAQGENEIHTTYYNSIEPILIELSKYPHGSVQWQESKAESGPWTDIPEANKFSVSYQTNTSMHVRAAVLSGTCDSTFSQYTSLKTLKVLTEGLDNLSDTSASVNCLIDTGSVSLSEYGLLYNTNPKVDETATRISFLPPAQASYSVDLTNLQDGLTYYARSYAISSDGTIIYGNILDFEPIKISLLRNLNISKQTAMVKYNVSGLNESEFEEHGIYINTTPESLPTSTKITGISDNGYLSATAQSLLAGTDYYVKAYITTGGKNFYSKEQKITTWSDYDGPVDTASFEIKHRIEWFDPLTAVKLNPEGTYADYARIERLGDSDTLMLVYHGGPNSGDWINIYMRKSYDNGETWEEQVTLMDLADYPGQYWRFCTPEILYLQNGWVMVAFEANARPDENKSSVQILISKDSAQTWEDPIIYVTGRTWEPAMVQLPHGEIELFYSSEAKWWPGDPLYQDIQVIRSTDNGESWSDPQVVAYFPNKRDGMPVPVALQGNKGVVFGIETVGSSRSPYIIHRDMDEPWILTTTDFYDSPHRWWIDGFSGHGGAPYILQLPSGETVLSAHIYRGGDWHQNNYQQVMVGDNDARNFESLANPWGNLQVGEGAVNNSLFMKDDDMITTVSTRTFLNGSYGIYWLKGKIVLK